MSAPAQPERERLLARMVERMDAAAQGYEREAQRGNDRAFGPAPTRVFAEAALRVIEEPSTGASESLTPCTCGHSGYAKDGPHQPGCPLA